MGFRYAIGARSYTPAAVANGGTITNTSSGVTTKNAAVSDIIKVKSMVFSGGAIATAVNSVALRRLSTDSTTPTNVAPGPLAALTGAASGTQSYVLRADAGAGVLASTKEIYTMDFNSFGGVLGMQFTPDDEVFSIGTTAPNSALNFGSVTGTGVMSVTAIFEAL